MNRGILSLGAVLVAAGFSILQAQDRAANDSLKALDQIVVTGTKTEKAIGQTPVRTDVITREDIERYASCNLYQILDGTPGIRMEQQCNNCNFSLLRMSGLEGGYAKILIDGMPVYSGLAGVYGMQQIQAGLIERIEIVRGSGSALYGSDAIAGVINVITRKPSPQPSMDVGAFVGVNPVNEKDRYGDTPLMTGVNFSAGHRKGNFAAIVAGQSNTADEIDNNGDLLTDRVQSKNLGGTTNLYWYDALGEKSTIGLMGRAIYEQRRGGGLQKINGSYGIDNPLDPGAEHIITERYETGLSIEKELPSATLVKGILNVVAHERSATNGAAWEKLLEATIDVDSITEDDFQWLADTSAKPFLTNERTVVGEINAAQPLGENNTLLAGVQVKRTDVEENINGDGWFARYFQDIGLFIQDEWDIHEKLGIVAGLRYDMHQSEDELTGSEYDESALNPRAALRFTAIPSLAARFSWGMGFRVPGDFSEDAHLCASAPRIQKNPLLKPERSMSFNVSLDYSKNNFTAGLVLNRTNIQDKVDLAEYEEPDEAYDLTWQNAEGTSYTQGFELNGGYEHSFFSVDVGYGFTDAQYEEEQIAGIEESKYVPRSPRHNAFLELGLFSDRAGTDFTDGWSLDMGARLLGSMYISRDIDIADYPGENLEEVVKTDPYVLVDARINKRFNSIGLDIYLAGENLTNTVQERKQWDVDDAAMMYAPIYGTTLMLGFDKEF